MKQPHLPTNDLADRLDAGWDLPEPSPSQPPQSTPLPASLDALDAAWETAVKPAPLPNGTSPASAQHQQRGGTARAGVAAARPSVNRPNPTRAVAPAPATGAVPFKASKQERRDAERRRRAHQAEQRAAGKKQRKAERHAEALTARERARQAEQALAEHSTRQSPERKRAAVRANPRLEGKQVPQRSQRAEAAQPKGARAEPKGRVVEARAAAPIVLDHGAKKLIIPLLIAIVVALTLGFALSRAR